MREYFRQAVLALATALIASLVLLPTFFALKLLLDIGLVILLVTVVGAALALGYLLARETSR